MRNQRVPVFMYHSVGIQNNHWIWNYLTCPWHVFESQIKWLKDNKYTTINLIELYDYVFHGKPIPRKSIILTFDDGYADNYVFAYPILKKYGYKGTIFVNPEFVDERNQPRLVFDGNNLDILETNGFLSWSEMKVMEAEGVMDIQSHALTHTWYPTSNEVIDFRHPKDCYHWMTWNEHTSLKPSLQIDNSELIRYGSPVYIHNKSLSHKRVYIEDRNEKSLIDFVNLNGGEHFFNNKNWKQILFSELQKLEPAKYTQENDKDFENRVYFELYESKRIIEENLNKKVDFLCWPGGSGTAVGVNVAERIGYKMTTAARDLDNYTRKKIQNSPKTKSNRIARISPVIKTSGIGYEQYTSFATSGFLWLRILSFKSPFFLKKIINLSLIVFGRFIRR